jgi:hypothetical protein
MKLSMGLVLFPVLVGCESQAGWSVEEGLEAEMIEVQVDETANVLEIEYHVAPSAVPAAVRAAMDALHPGGEATGAEKEYAGSTLYWEVTKKIEGRDVEAMFLPDGTLHSEEIEVAAASVPQAVQAAVTQRIGSEITKWEEIHDAERVLVEYHAKATAKGMKYKLRVDPTGKLLGVVREVPAEIELPVD